MLQLFELISLTLKLLTLNYIVITIELVELGTKRN